MREPNLDRAIEKLGRHKSNILRVGKLVIPDAEHFREFRSLVLDELGERGFESEIRALLADRNGME